MAAESPARITRVVLKNYKSIVHCDVELKPLTILVGPNGSGKSNFLDALRFVSEALTVGLEQAIRNRGNFDRILSASHAFGDYSFSIDVEFRLDSGDPGRYLFAIGEVESGDNVVFLERLDLFGVIVNDRGDHFYWSREVGQWSQQPERTMWDSNSDFPMHPLYDGRLFLIDSALDPRVRSVYELLANMAFYNPQPDAMRALKLRDVAPKLQSDGANVASVLRRIQAEIPETMWSITQYMQRVLPGFERFDVIDLAGRDLLKCVMRSADDAAPYAFDADQLSDGTLRALAVLVALRQPRLGSMSATSVIGVEEPENYIHPAAARLLLAAMQDASYDTQVLATTHSADMLHMGEIQLESILAVSADAGVTTIGPIDDISRGIVRDGLFTVGELMQMDQIHPQGTENSATGSTAAPAPPDGVW